MSNLNYELIESGNELNEPTSSNFRIQISVELRTTNSNANYSNYELGNCGLDHIFSCISSFSHE